MEALVLPFVVNRAKELLKNLTDTVLPDSQELADEVAYSVRVMEVQEYGRDRLHAGPAIDESEEVLVVEGRADVLNLLKHGFKNVIAMNGTSVPQTIIDLSKHKTICAFVDGDRGGDLIIQELMQVAELDFVTKAPDGKEVEELTQKEIHKSLRGKISAEQAKLDFSSKKPLPRPSPSSTSAHQSRSHPQSRGPQQSRQQPPRLKPSAPKFSKKPALSADEKSNFKQMLEDLIGTRGAYILDKKLTILGKVPVTELVATVKSLSSGVYAIVLDGVADKDLVMTAEKIDVQFVVSMDSKVKESKVTILTAESLD